jgi:hypothetical protein
MVCLSPMDSWPKRSERIGGLLTMVEQDRRGRLYRSVFVNYGPVVRFAVDELVERKLAAIQLIELGHCNQKNAGLLCELHRNTVSKILELKDLLGVEAVVKDHRGIKGPYKYTEDVLHAIEELLAEDPDWSDQAIADKTSKKLSMKISRSAVLRIRTRRTPPAPREPLTFEEIVELAKAADAVDKKRWQTRQLELNFEADPQFRQAAGEFSQEPGPAPERTTEQTLVERLSHGVRNDFAGGLMHQLFLQKFDFEAFLRPYPLLAGSTYKARDVLGTLLHSALWEISSIEALKLINASDFGLLLGRSRSPDKETLRERLTALAEQYRSGELIDAFAARLLELARIDREVFFIDGHFLPYYGLSVLAKGYHTMRRLAMKGNELYLVSDLQGRPLWFRTDGAEIDFRPVLSCCADKLIELGIDRPTLVFDRGGYGLHFFHELSTKADFVTWAKYVTKSSLAEIPREAFREGLAVNGSRYLIAEERRTVRESSSTARKDGRDVPTAMELRLVVFEDQASGARIGIYTNNTSRPAGDIAYYMLQRWGKSENLYKELMARFYLNYHPGYDIEILETQPLVDNPDVALYKRAQKTLQGELSELRDAVELTEARIAKRPDKRFSKKREALLAEIARVQTDLEELTQKLQSTPEKISILDLLQGRPMSRCDLEKKKLYDLMQFLAYHSRERLLEIFRHCYHDPRDIKPVLDRITRKSGYVKLFGNTLVVLLDWIEDRNHRNAAQELCRRLNQMTLRLPGPLGLRLYFRVSAFPGWTRPLPQDSVYVSC